jgi:spindle assembly checkpoint component MAD3
MQVFVDPSGASADDALAAEDTVATPWNELGTRKERIKENVPKVSKLKGTTLSQPGRQQRITSTPAVSMSSRISVFRDPAPGEGDMMPPPLAASDAKVRGKEREVPKTPGCSSIIPFKDEVKEAPSTPRFVPFKDEVVSVCTLL